ncbi:hypothetical protein GCM10010521_49830 [Streptomyces rameus]|uniref:Transposase IS30-like HTH domain-containing protein n=1 Tax=Streptomyces rameus TaxID=68261 RepID=A0ABP6NR18_9ACTN
MHVRTARGWHNGRLLNSGRLEPPVRSQRAAVPVSSGRYLGEHERVHIADRLREKASLRTIAAELGRSPSTISREIRRNGALWRGAEWTYRPQPRFTASMVMISDRPAEAADRAVPGHWEGDCVGGAGHRSAIGTLVERTTRFTMLVHVPNGHRAEHFHQALTTTISRLPPHLRRRPPPSVPTYLWVLVGAGRQSGTWSHGVVRGAESE